MTATVRTRDAARWSVMGLFLILCAAIALGVCVLAWGELAVAGVFGLVAFGVFLMYPVLGLYATTALLLLAGSGATIGSIQAAIPVTGAKLCGAAAVLAWLANLLMRKQNLRLGWEILLLVAFLGWAALGIANSAVWRDQVPEWIRLATLVGYFILAVHLLDTREKLHYFVMLILVCGLIMSLFALAQYVLPSLQFSGEAGFQGLGAGAQKAYVDYEGVQSGPAIRVSGRAGHSNWLAMALLLILPLNTYWFSTAKSWRGKCVAVVAVLCEVTALILTFTRLGLLVGLAVATVLVFKRLVRFNPYRVSALAVALVAAWFVLPSAYKERVIDFTQYSKSSSTHARMDLQRYAWEYMEDEPLVGEGLGGFGLRFQGEDHWVAANLRWLIDNQGWDPVYYGPHNMYLQLGAETGVVGLLLALLLLARLIRNVQRSEKALTRAGDRQAAQLAGAIEVSLLSFVFCALFLHALLQKIWWMVAVMAVVFPLIHAHVAAPKKPDEPTRELMPT
ncbi:MAG: O-antigen ligase family protein [Candidatus Hydrogenedentes bacterium]|nr:O-antigen ligase family protein [Candidatus Hydrogenedentota bacterium]